MGLDDIADNAKKRSKKERAEKLGLDSIDQLDDIEEVKDKLNSISQAHVSQDKRIEDLEEQVETLWTLIKVLIDDREDSSNESVGVGDGKESEEEDRTGQERTGYSTDEGSDSEGRGTPWG